MKRQIIQNIVHLALKEDLGHGDITTQLVIPPRKKTKARILAKENGIFCGALFIFEVFRQMNPNLQVDIKVMDGGRLKKGQTIAIISGNAQAIITGERVALNFISHLSGIATLTHQLVKKAGSRVKILETRKTIPGLRFPEKFAVLCGGGHNHRMDLNQTLMIKDNHLMLCGGMEKIPELIKKIHKKTSKKIVLEVDNLKQYKVALAAKPDIILLDNFKLTSIKKAVKLRNQFKEKRILLECSGGITNDTISAIVQTGVDRISIGALTHSFKSLDCSLEIMP